MFLSCGLHVVYSVFTNFAAFLSFAYHGLKNSSKTQSRKQCYSKIKGSKNILFYAASMGESLSVISFIKEINKKYPNFNIVIATQTQSSAKTVARYIKELGLQNTYHVYAVLDASFLVKNFLTKVNPCMVFWVESEFWYNHLRLIKKRNIPLVLLNARFSQRALNRWKKLDFVLKKLLSYFDVITAKTENIADAIYSITGFKAHFIGDIKISSSLFLSKNLPYGNLEKLNFIKTKPCYVAISTHSNEEEILTEIHSNIAQRNIGFLTIIIPRHAERAKEILKQIKSKNIKVSLLSDLEDKNPDIGILIVDCYGKVKDICSLVNLAFVGKSISSKVKGGQNPFEPIFFGLNTLIGKNYQNFYEDVKELESRNLIKIVKSKQELEQAIVDSVFNKNSQSSNIEGYLKHVGNIAKNHLLFFNEVLNEQYN